MSKNLWAIGLFAAFFLAILNFGNEAMAQVACTMDAKICPDGSYVGRQLPNCQFAPCPSSSQSHFTASPLSGSAPLKVTFNTNYGDDSSYRPSAADGQDTLIDFGDGSERLWVQCKTANGSNAKNCKFVLSDTESTLDHTYAKKGTYVAKLIKTGGHCIGTCPTTELAKVTIAVSDPTPYAATDISQVTLKSIDPIPEAVDDEYGEYTIKLKSGKTHIITAYYFTGGLRLTALNETGYTGTLEQFKALVNETGTNSIPGSNSNRPAIILSHNFEGPQINATFRFRKTSASQSCNQSNYGTVSWGDGSSEDINITRCEGNTWLVADKNHSYPSNGSNFSLVITDKVNNTKLTEQVVVHNDGVIFSFFRRVADGLNNTFTSVVNFFFPGRAAEVTKRQFSEFPSTDNNYQGGTRLKSDIDAILINKEPGNTRCSRPYGAYIITSKPPEVGLSSCSEGENVDDYLSDIATELKQHSFEPLTVNDLKSLPIYIGDVDSVLQGVTDIDSGVDPTKIPNALGLEVKVKNKSGTVIQDWVKGNPTIGPTDQISLRWNVSGYAQCLPFFADNGNYAITRPVQNSKMLNGNTETEKYNLLERTGLYYIECSDSEGENVEVGSILLTVTENSSQHGIDLGSHERFKIEVDKTNPLKVNVSYTNDKATCNPKYVGKITWGDGTNTFEPDFVTQECGAGKTATTSHIYSSAKAYQINISRSGVQKHKETVHLGGTATTNFSAKPTTGSSPLAVEFKLNTKKAAALDFGDGQKETFSCSTSGTQTNTVCGERKIMHNYTANGTYQATLTDTDGSKKTIPIIVSNNALGASPTSGTAPLKVTFTFSQTGSSLLIFGDGSKSQANDCSGGGTCVIEKTYTYQKPGTYEARLITGCTSTASSSCATEAKVQKTKIIVSGPTTNEPTNQNCRDKDLSIQERISCWRNNSEYQNDRDRGIYDGQRDRPRDGNYWRRFREGAADTWGRIKNSFPNIFYRGGESQR